MGNAIGFGGRKKRVKIMKINGETIKLKPPIKAVDVTNTHPGHALLDSESVKHFGIRTKSINADKNLDPNRLYFLVELSELPNHAVPRRVKSGIQMSAKDRLESLMLARRSASDLTIIKPANGKEKDGTMRVRMRLPKAEVARLMNESRDEAEAAEKIVDLCVSKSGTSSVSSSGSLSSLSSAAGGGGGGSSLSSSRSSSVSSIKGKEVAVGNQHAQQHDRQKKKVGFLPVREGERSS